MTVTGRMGPAAGTPHLFSTTISIARRWEIISTYGRVLEKRSSSVEKEADLPYTKRLIRRAICEELLENPDMELRAHLEVAFARLESFLPPEDYQVIQAFKDASNRAQEMASKGDPQAIITSARILKRAKGDKAVKILEKISEMMRKRLEQIRGIGMPVLGIPSCGCRFGF